MGFDDELAAAVPLAEGAAGLAAATERARAAGERRRIEELDRIIAEYAVPAAATLQRAGVLAEAIADVRTPPLSMVPTKVTRRDQSGWRMGALVMTTSGHLYNYVSTFSRAPTKPARRSSHGSRTHSSAREDWKAQGRAGLRPGESVIAVGHAITPEHLVFRAYRDVNAFSADPSWWLEPAAPELCLQLFGPDTDTVEPLRSIVVRGTAHLLQGR
jgi:hypothetical protein